MNESHPLSALWLRHHPSGPYPTGVVAVPRPIPGRAFFPGGYGLWSAKAGTPLPPLPVGGVMILGHDFHSEAGYSESLRLGAERDSLPTWTNLRTLLHEANISPERCFFTNFYVGLRRGTATTGRFPGAGDRDFAEHCSQFIIEQVKLLRPRVVLTLGMQVPPLIGRLSPQLSDWCHGSQTTIKFLDAAGPVRHDVELRGLSEFHTTVVALIHPSLRHGSLRHRRYGNRAGNSAELQMLLDADAAAV